MGKQSRDIAHSLKLMVSNHINYIRQYAADNPDDPMINHNPKDVVGSDYQALTSNRITFVDLSSKENLMFTLWLPESAITTLSSGFPYINGAYQAVDISLEKTGLFITGPDDGMYIHITDNHYAILNNPFVPDDFSLKGRDACEFSQTLMDLHIEVEANVFILAIQRNFNWLNVVRDEAPYLLNHPGIQQALSDAFLKNKIPAPKKLNSKPDITKGKFELYHWVYWYRQQGQTLENACMKAVEEHSEIVPSDWTDPYETLKKLVTRMDKYPSISQKRSLGTV